MKIKRFILLAFSGCCLALSGAACSGLEGDNSDFDFGDMTSDAPDNPYDGQGYDRLPNSVRLATYNTHRCEGWTQNSGTDRANYNNTAKVISLMDPDVIALQELDSASQSRGNRYLLHEIAKHTGIEYTDVYANAARFDKKGSIGCGALVRKNLPIVSRYIAYLPGDEPRAAIQLELEKFVFIATHSDLNNEKRRQGTKIICNDSREMKKPVFVAGDLNDSFRWSRSNVSFPLYQKDFIIASDTVGNTIPGRTDNGALIDFILLSKKGKNKIKIVGSKIVREINIEGKTIDLGEISDHYPVFTDIICK